MATTENDPAIDLDQLGADWAALLESMPDGSRIERRDGLYHVYRGQGSTSHGSGRSLGRAFASINSMRGFDENGRPCEFAENGEILPPESA